MYIDKKNGDISRNNRDYSRTNKINPDQNWWQRRNIGSKGFIIGGIIGLFPGIGMGGLYMLYMSLYTAVTGLGIGAILGIIRFFIKSILSPFKKNESHGTSSIPQTTPTKVESINFCQNCNIQNDLDALFCTSCGKKFSNND